MPISAAAAASTAGLLVGLSLIVAFGAQNLFVLRQGIARQHVGLVVTICAASDLALIAAGVAGASALLRRHELVLVAVRAGGAALLVGYAALALRRARRGLSQPGSCVGDGVTRRSAVATCLGFTWLNPGVYLDSLVVLGTVANTWSGRRWWFAAGAALASLVWFAALGFGSRLLSPLLASPRSWKMLDTSTALVMALIALRLAVG